MGAPIYAITFNILIVVFIVSNGSDEFDRKEVIVVGGGLAGMAAARKLLQSGKFDVKVFEGQNDRYGGRMWTNRKAMRGLKGVDLELGSMFINTKANNNPLHELVKKFELEVAHSGEVQVIFPDQTGDLRVVSGDNATSLYIEAFKVVINAVNRVRAAGVDSPLLKEILDQYNTDRENIGKTEVERKMVLDIIKSLPVPLCNDFSTLQYDAEHDFGWDSILVDGQDALIDRIVSGEGTEAPIKIQLNKVVRNIKVDEKRRKVLVRTTDRKQAIVDAVILAVPIGVLKERSVIFEPALPRPWYEAVRDIGLGYSAKVIVKFDEIFWPKDIGSFLVSSSTAVPGLLQMWTSTYRVSGNPVLIGSIYGEQAKSWEKMSITKLKSKVKIILSEMFGEDVVAARKFELFLRSNWSTDSLTLGSISYPKVGNQPELWETLRKPVCPHIYFAGAHLESVSHVDSMHGAYNSGIRTAEQIINGVCKNDSKKKTSGSSKTKHKSESGKTKQSKTESPKHKTKKKDEL